MIPGWARSGLLAPLLLAAGLSAGMAQNGGGTAPPAISDLPMPDAPATAPDTMPTRTIESGAAAPRLVIAPVLTVDQDRLFADSAWGRRAQRQLEEAGQKVANENQRLAAQLAAEEADLTQRRATLEPAEFRRLTEAFDARATKIRRERAQAVQDLNARADADRTAFYQAALPIMGELMQQRGAVAVLDRRTVFVSLDSIDITGDLIDRLDERLGDGAATGTALDAGALIGGAAAVGAETAGTENGGTGDGGGDEAAPAVPGEGGN